MHASTGNEKSDMPHRVASQLQASLGVVEEMLVDSARSMTDDRWFSRLGRELEVLHAQMRIHHAASIFGGDDDPATAAPELTADEDRLIQEHYIMLGHLDRLIRAAKSIAAQGAEDQTVFIWRVRELVAMIRRHEAEEKRLVYVALWRDTGGGG